MHGGGIHATEFVFLSLLTFVAVFAAIARKLQRPYPIVLVLAGLLLSFFPRVPKVTLNPDFIFLVVLPPLLYSAAWLTSWREFRFNLVSISMLAIGLVVATVMGIARTARWVIPGFTWQLGFVLGAVVSTTDAIAATSIAKRVGLPQRVVDILEGESLVNDASGLVALEFGLAMVVRSQTPTVLSALGHFCYVAIAGIAVGLLIGKLVEWFEHSIDDGPIEIAISILVPYISYLVAEAAHASGVLSVVACGLYLSRRSARFFSPQVRLQAWAVWDAMTFALNGLVFVLIGLQLPYVRAGIRSYSMGQLLFYGVSLSALLIAVAGDLGVSRRPALVFYSEEDSASGLRTTRSEADFHRGMDRHAGRGGSGGGDGHPGTTSRRLAISATQPHHLSHLLRDSRDPGIARTESAVDYPEARLGRHEWPELRGKRSAPDRCTGRARSTRARSGERPSGIRRYLR